VGYSRDRYGPVLDRVRRRPTDSRRGRGRTILVLDRGRLAEAGTHAGLLERGGLYADLYERQFRPEAFALES
jgi:hypothetical protein